MDAKQRRWWVIGSLLVLVCVGLTWAAYRFAWLFTGFMGKTLWDWLQLLIIPLVVAFGATIINQVNTSTERDIALDKQREDLLQSYLDKMSELLLEKKLRDSQPNDEVRNIARVRTTSTLIQLDAKRVGYVFAFLREASLIDRSTSIISLSGANFRGVKWNRTILSSADLSSADLSSADLRSAYLGKAHLSKANLSGAYLSDADLSGADLEGAKIKKEKLSIEQRAQAIRT